MELPRDVASLIVPKVGRLRVAEQVPAGWEITDASGEPIPAVSVYLHHLVADDFSEEARRSYGNALLRWLRFLSAIGTTWDRATASNFNDFITWLQVATPQRGGALAPAGSGYAPRTINHNWTVVSHFYEFHAWAGSGPIVSPVAGPFRRSSNYKGKSERQHRRAVGRQKVPKRAPRAIPDAAYDALFVLLGHDRDRALISLYLSTGARATELLNIKGGDIDWGENRIRVVRKGSRDEQWIPASPDAIVWLRLYIGTRRIGPNDPVWLTRRKPLRPLVYTACRRVFIRAQEKLGTHYTLHQLRHSAAYRMVQDPNLLITDVQWVLGHAGLDTTQIYIDARPEEVYKRMLEHFQRPRIALSDAPLAKGYDPDVMRGLFGGDS